MNRFETKEKNYIFNQTTASVIIFAVIMTMFIIAVSFIAKRDYMDSKEVLNDAIKRDVIHCFAVEGHYPESVGYMEENYGLIYDQNKYIVDYTLEGDNIYPTVVIIERSEE